MGREGQLARKVRTRLETGEPVASTIEQLEQISDPLDELFDSNSLLVQRDRLALGERRRCGHQA